MNQFVGCGYNWINNDFMVFIILQNLSSKFSNFMIVIETRIDNEEDVFSLENLLRIILNYGENINKNVFISSLNNNNVSLEATKSSFKKKFDHHKKSFP